MNLPNRAVSYLVEMIRAWPWIKKMLADYMGTVVIEARTDGGTIGEIAPRPDTELYYLREGLALRDWEGPATGAAAPTELTSGHPYWSFPKAGADSRIRAQWVVPDGYDPSSTQVVFRLYHFNAGVAASGNVRANLSVDVVNDGNNWNTKAGSLTATAATLTLTSRYVMEMDDITVVTGLDGIGQGELVLIELQREDTHAADTLSSPWGVAAVAVRYRNDSLGRYP